MAELTQEQRQKISDGMKRAHAKRKKWYKKPSAPRGKRPESRHKKAPAGPTGALLGQLRTERAELDQLINLLEKRGLK